MDTGTGILEYFQRQILRTSPVNMARSDCIGAALKNTAEAVLWAKSRTSHTRKR